MSTELSAILGHEVGEQSLLEPVFRLAHLNTERRIRIEQARIAAKKDPWPLHNSSLRQYESEFGWAPENIRSALDRMLAEQESVICVVLGKDDNPLEEYMQRRHASGKNAPIVITVSLEDRRSQAQIARDMQLGRYVVSASVGTPELYDRLQEQMDVLQQAGITSSNKADMMVSQLVGGWGDVPFVEHVKEMLAYTLENPESMIENELHEIAMLSKFFQSLSPEDVAKLSTAYANWMVQRIRSLLNTSCTVFGELPVTLDHNMRQLVPDSYKDEHITFAKNTWKNNFYLRMY